MALNTPVRGYGLLEAEGFRAELVALVDGDARLGGGLSTGGGRGGAQAWVSPPHSRCGQPDRGWAKGVDGGRGCG